MERHELEEAFKKCQSLYNRVLTTGDDRDIGEFLIALAINGLVIISTIEVAELDPPIAKMIHIPIGGPAKFSDRAEVKWVVPIS